MRIPAVKTNPILVLVAGVAMALPVFVEAEPPAAGEGAPAEAPAESAAAAVDPKAPAKTEASTTATTLDYLFNRKAQDGTAAKNLETMTRRYNDKVIAQDALGAARLEDPEMRARFERYLSMAEVPQDQLKAYQSDYDEVLALLKQNKPFEAWKKLSVLADYKSIDAGLSWELSNRIESIWNTDKTAGKLDDTNDKLRRQVEITNRNADILSTDIKRKETMDASRASAGNKKGEGGAAPSNNGGGGSMAGLEGKLQLTEEYLKSLETKAKIKLNELKVEKISDQAKADFASYITTLFNSGRYRHVILAADFYRRIFDEGEYPVAMAQQVTASLEISREVDSAVEVFTYKVEKRDVAAATDRLQEAFVTSEFHPAVLGLPREKKEKVEAFTSRLNKMQNMIEARDFGNLESLLKQMSDLAADFDSTKPMAIVDAIKLESKLRLGKAKLAAQTGDKQLAMDEFQAAAEAWPKNPDLQASAGTFFDAQDLKSQTLVEFDRLVAENNVRAIFDKQLSLAPALKDDTKRQEQLKDALLKVKDAEVAVEKATALRNNGDVFGAWETIEEASAIFPQDNKLNGLRADLSGKAAEFVSAINKAKEAQARNELGYCLTWYAIAQRQYPASTIANKAIEKLTKEILEGKTL